MPVLTKQILKHIAEQSEGTPLAAKELLHLGSRAAVDQALSRLARRGALLRAGRGIYVRPIESAFGTRTPSANKVVVGLENQRGETIVLHGAAAANALGLTTQAPMRVIYLTSGHNRHLKLGEQTIEFRHAPIWQLIFPRRVSGDVIRALAWLGPEKAGEAISKLRSKLSSSDVEEIAGVRSRLPTWLAKEVSALMSHG
jgi:hypothetical protein